MFILITSFATSTLLLTVLASTSAPEFVALPCNLLNNENGTCIPVNSCALAKQLFQIHDVAFLQRITCGFDRHTPLVCCPDVSTDAIQFNVSESTTVAPVTNQTTPELKPESENAITTPIASNSSYTTPLIVLKQPEVQDTLGGMSGVVAPATEANPPAGLVQSTLLPSRKTCGISSAVNERIVGGDLADIDEFPWIARLKFVKEGDQKEIYACAGSLINRRYVLTAAHCMVNKVYKLAAVRLGEWDTESAVDCVGTDCSDPAIDVDIEEIIVHPDFDADVISKADIALVRLNRTVPYTDFVRPICLPTTEYVKGMDYFEGNTYRTAGWGRTESGGKASILRKVDVGAVPIDICKVSVPKMSPEQYDTVICAGGRKGHDTCAGDSGGGLIKAVVEEKYNNFFLFGITSYGMKRCGTEGVPSVYTRVTPYMDWIQHNLKP
ncbi:CLIP domain-containing serine protease HP8 [Plutella xylostella]|uniref:CLIP domain-containing serine protease HP8 n=1 Tax=Plutella xylostella TaxID=51655 RepID=UPI002032F84E|nr:CLIP domain-containing serine protease HP8 [Plutella xylostella]